MYHYSWFFLIPGVEHGEVLHALESLPGHQHAELANAHVIPAAWTVVLLLTLLAVMARSGLNAARAKGGVEQYVPADNASARNLMEIAVESLLGLAETVIGRRDIAIRYFPLLGTLFFYVLFSNLMGLVPGFLPPTSSISNNFAMAIVVFLVFNYAGFKENGLGYLKHIAGPVWWLAPVIFVLEGFSILVRPVTLSLRLYMNMFADHLLLGVFSDLVAYVIPAAFVGLGLFVCFVQAFIFTLLPTVYIALSTAHEGHDEHGSHDHAGHGHGGHDHGGHEHGGHAHAH